MQEAAILQSKQKTGKILKRKNLIRKTNLSQEIIVHENCPFKNVLRKKISTESLEIEAEETKIQQKSDGTFGTISNLSD